ncbi:MAG TPA: hypothetical protein VNS55_00710 [Nocardioides sp.]|nr:hypothetical protein [Nocardioides sp.]
MTLYSFSNADQASTKSDGQNTTISLVAGATSDIDSVRFQFSTDAGTTWTNIGPVMTSPNDDGSYSYEWNPVADSGLTLPAVGVLVRANGHSNLDGLDHPGSSFPVTVSSTFDSVAVTPGSDLGVWKANDGQHKVILSGTTSYAAGPVRVGVMAPNGSYAGFVDTASAANKYKTILDIQPFYPNAPFGYSAPDQVEVTAFTGPALPASSDGEGYTLYNQEITTITASANPTNPPNNLPVPTTITVKDQKGNPIPGVNVSRGPDGGPYAALGTTDINGQVATTQAIPDGAVRYIANVATGDQVVENGAIGDKSTVLTLGQAYAADLVGTSADGSAFDFDEQDGNDVQVQVKDQAGNNFDVQSPTQTLTYHWTKTPFFFNETIVGTSHTLNVETNGKYDIPALNPADFSFGLEPGTYKLFASLSEGGTGHAVTEKQVLSVKVGQARVQASDVIAPAGSTASVPATLVLDDGTPLPGRKVNITVNLGTEYNEHGQNTFTPDAVLVSNTPDTTSGSGTFTPKVEDLSHDPNMPELGDSLTFTSAVSSFGDWNGGAVSDSPRIDFVSTSAPAGAKLNIEYGGGVVPVNITDPGNADSSGPAGSAQGGGLLLVDSAGDPLVGVQVALTVDHGFFVPVGAPNKAPAEGDYVPTPNSLGTTINVVTGPTGRASFNTSIGRDAGFDDDGLVTAKVTGTISAATDNDTNVWSSATPLNVSEVSIVRTPDARQANPVDPAAAGNPVLFDVFAKDQFGNPAAGVHVNVTCDALADDGCPAEFPALGIPATSDFDNGGDFQLVSGAGGTFDFTATVDNIVTETYGPANLFTPQAQTVKDDFSQVWYAIDFTHSTFTIGADPGTSDVPTDTPVTVTVTATDQEGNPIQGLLVQFVRTSDADNDQSFFTDANGEAQYVFQGTPQQCGSQDTVTAVARNGSTIVSQQNITIHFSKCEVSAALSGHSSRDGRKDILKVSATTADGGSALTGTPVTLMAKIDGSWVHVGPTGVVLDSSGKAKVAVRDRNGDNVTKYKAMIEEHGRNAAAVSNKARVH